MRSITKVLSGGVVALASAALVVGGSTAAHAASDTVNDTQRDVWEFTYDPETETSDVVKAGSVVNTDIDVSRVKHTASDLVLTTAYRDLAKKGDYYGAFWTIRNGAGDEWIAYVSAGQDNWAGEAAYFVGGPQSGRMTARAAGSSCRGVSHQIDYRADTVRMTVPRRCFDRAARVAVQSTAGSTRISGEGDNVQYRQFFDNGHNKGNGYRGWTRMLSAG